jgi:hypothetical protein
MFLTSPYIDQAIALIDSVAGGGAVERRASGRRCGEFSYFSFSYSVLAALSSGTSGSASFHNAKKS